MTAPIIGIDIHHTGVSAVLLQIGFRRIELQQTAAIQFSETPDIPAAVTRCLDTLSEKCSIIGASAAVSIPSGDAFYRNLELPFSKSQDIEKILPYELDSVLPYSTDQLSWDTQIIRKSMGRCTLLTISVLRNRIAEILSAVQPYRLAIRRILSGLFFMGIVRQHLAETPPAWMAVDQNGNVLSLCVTVDGRISMMRSISLGKQAHDLSNEISREIHHTLLTAEQFLGRPVEIECVFLNREDQSTQSVGLEHPHFSSVFSDVRVKSLDLFSGNRWFQTPAAPFVWDPAYMNRAMAGALILAKRFPSPDLRDYSGSLWNSWRDYRSRWKEIALLGTAALSLGGLGTWVDISVQQNKLDRLDHTIQQRFLEVFPAGTPMINPVEQVDSAIREMARNELLQTGPTGFSVLETLKAISAGAAPEMNITIRRLGYAKHRVQLNGIASDFDTVYAFRKRMEQNKLFETVTLVSSHQDKAENRIHFVMELTPRLKSPE